MVALHGRSTDRLVAFWVLGTEEWMALHYITLHCISGHDRLASPRLASSPSLYRHTLSYIAQVELCTPFMYAHLCSLSFSRLLLGNDVVIVRHLRHPREQHLEVCEHVLERCRPSLVAVEAVVDGQAVDLVVLAAEREKADEGGE